MLNIKKCHDAKYWWKGLDLSNIVCEYEVNRLTNENVINGKRNLTVNCLRRQPAQPPAHPDSLIYKLKFSRNIRLKTNGKISLYNTLYCDLQNLIQI